MWNKTGYNVQESRERLRREGENTMRKTESQKIALCGMLGALSVVLLLIGSALQIGTYAAPMLAAFLLIPVLEDYGPVSYTHLDVYKRQPIGAAFADLGAAKLTLLATISIAVRLLSLIHI